MMLSVERLHRQPDCEWSGKVAKTENGQVVETAQEARQAEPGPSILVVLGVSLSAVIFILAVVWFIFFKT